MKRFFIINLFIILLFTESADILAQSDLQIFGFYQARVTKTQSSISIKGDIPAFGIVNKTFTGLDNNFTSPYVQQLNLMLRKELTSNITSFIDFEFTNNFSTEKNWGELNLEETWLNFEYAPDQNIKGGLLIPKFGSLNEIKNRMPLLPYILRPILYESTFRNVVDPSDFLPERAFVQLQGKFFSNELELNYAAYIGSSESGYIESSDSAMVAVRGSDTTNFKLFGGRLGLKYNTLRFGISSTIDKDNQQALYKEDIQRVRLGFDFAYSFANFYFDGELIKVMLDPKNTNRDLNKLFYYATLEYDFTDKIFAYGTYSYIQDNASDFLKIGLTNILTGAGYRASNSVVLKAQYSTNKLDGTMPLTINPALPPITANAKIDSQFYSLAVSVLF